MPLSEHEVGRLASVIERMTGDALGVIESIVAAREQRARAAAWEECFESGTPWENPYAVDPDAGTGGSHE